MLISAMSNALANRIDAVMPRLDPEVVDRVTPETHGSAVELRTGVHSRVSEAMEEITFLRRNLSNTLKGLQLRAAAFPRVGIPRPFHSYEQYVEEVDLMIRTDAIPESTFLWWDIRPQPGLGTIEIRIMDSQTRTEDTAALVALTRCMVRAELHESRLTVRNIDAQEIISENRFIAARDGIEAELIDAEAETRTPVREIVAGLFPALLPHAQDLGCVAELEHISELAHQNGAVRQRRISREVPSLAQMVGVLADELE